MELTQEHFDKQVKILLDTVASKVEVNEKFSKLEQTLGNHTTTLDSVVKNTDSWRTEKAAIDEKLNRYDRWFKLIGAQIKLKLEDK